MAAPRFLAIASVRNEGAFLLDWITHHCAVGFTDFLIYSNDCDDGSDLILDHLAGLGLVVHRPNPGPYKGGIQFTAMKRAAEEAVYQAADYVMALDLDEYLNIHVGAGKLADLVAACPDMAAVSVTWRMFGSSGEIHYRPGDVTRQFTRAAPEVMFWPWRAFLFKTLFAREAGFARPGIHRPQRRSKAPLTGTWYDSQGRIMPDGFTETTRPFAYFGQAQYALAQINHYAVQSAEAFVLKADRGRAVHEDHSLDISYWIERNWNDVEDLSIHRYAEGSDTERTGLLADPDLADLHAKAILWRQNRLADILKDERFRDLFAQAVMADSSRILPKHEAIRLHGINHATRNSNSSQ
jgi:hypothetical protein